MLCRAAPPPLVALITPHKRAWVRPCQHRGPNPDSSRDTPFAEGKRLASKPASVDEAMLRLALRRSLRSPPPSAEIRNPCKPLGLLLVPEGFDRVELGGAAGWPDSEEHAHADRDQHAGDRGRERHGRGQRREDQTRDQRDRPANYQSQDSTHDGQHHGLGQELQYDVGLAGPYGPCFRGGDFTGPMATGRS